MNARSQADIAAASAGRELVTINEAAVRTRVCRRTVENWIRLGKIDYVRTAGGKVRIYADTLLIEKVPRR